ncbi:MAG: hypothetical protein DNFNHJIP_00074 [Candidatus Argoarchaeum ethanivorans]|uniref:Uncharacterized protein n=1 Tax=Candidatus Argoarchaeum ethanivorans TaxID=2608793 RepID=A0A811ZZ50_9EURY|nr:MAG: hypothetical protein DNFNHJIP_00074 [Candidatus Argoarchaeum ethanivorans]
MDDCNHLKDWQIQVVNSAISRATNPVSYKVTCVYGLYKSNRTADGRPLNEQELKTLKISGADEACWEYNNKFIRLAKGVCHTRIEESYGKQFADQFDFKKMFGEFDLQQILLKRLKISEKEKAIELLEKVRSHSKKRKNLSVTNVWLSEKKIREKDKPSNPNPEIQGRLIRRLNSMYLKKWNHAAAIAICQELKIPFPYSGWTTILHLCSGSIRDYLRIISEFWDTLNKPIEKFVKIHNINPVRQQKVIKRASVKRFNELERRPLFKVEGEPQLPLKQNSQKTPATSLASICERMGELFAEFQSYPSIGVTAESASLKVKIDELDDEMSDVINFAVMAGAILKNEKDYMTIGLHPILSPKFNISFRSPFYYPETIQTSDLTKLFKGSDKDAEKIKIGLLNDRLNRLSKFDINRKEQKVLFDM